ncbi:DUF2726 domain-containing protein [Cerasicoccus maritimus]|uniref:DUF2726 domain-containing protein n=1 Tax=Cerasicoccus maritimus TaxID=490089 RepID=UPI0028524C6E|nr:DUF2726 domain-containing protein [Cerasicoccus maritimus]
MHPYLPAIAAVDFSPLISTMIGYLVLLAVFVLVFTFFLAALLYLLKRFHLTYILPQSLQGLAIIRQLLKPAESPIESDQPTAELDYPYSAVDRILSPAEELFSHALMEAIGDDWTALVKLRLADVLDVTATGKAYMPAFRRISQKHIDFLLIDPETTAPLLAIELDDRSHLRTDRQERDAFVDAALAAAGLPILHIPCAASYNAQFLRQEIQEILRPVQKPEQSAQPDADRQPFYLPSQTFGAGLVTPPAQRNNSGDTSNDHLDARYMPKR